MPPYQEARVLDVADILAANLPVPPPKSRNVGKSKPALRTTPALPSGLQLENAAGLLKRTLFLKNIFERVLVCITYPGSLNTAENRENSLHVKKNVSLGKCGSELVFYTIQKGSAVYGVHTLHQQK